MVTMNSDKAATKRKPEPNNGGCTGAPGAPSNAEEGVHTQTSISEESPNCLLYKKVLSGSRPRLYIILAITLQLRLIMTHFVSFGVVAGFFYRDTEYYVS